MLLYEAVRWPPKVRPRPQPTGRSRPIGILPPASAIPPTGATIFWLHDVICPSVHVEPFVVGSTAMPGMKWSTPLFTPSIGILATSDHDRPSFDFAMTMSFDEQPLRNRQSAHTT